MAKPIIVNDKGDLGPLRPGRRETIAIFKQKIKNFKILAQKIYCSCTTAKNTVISFHSVILVIHF